MLKVNVVDADKNPDPLRAGQVRTDGDGMYVLVITDGSGEFNAIKLSGESSFVEDFETLFSSFVTYRTIEQDYPIVVDAELTIKGA